MVNLLLWRRSPTAELTRARAACPQRRSIAPSLKTKSAGRKPGPKQLDDPRLVLELVGQARGDFLGAALQELGLGSLDGTIDLGDALARSQILGRQPQVGRAELFYRLGFRRHDALQRGIARLVDAGLNGNDRGQ